MLTLIFGIRASEPPPGPGERLKRPGLIGLNDVIKMKRNFRLLMEIILLLAGINVRLEKRRVPLGRPEHHGKQC